MIFRAVFTLRQLIAAVAVVAALLGAWSEVTVLRRRSIRREGIARLHALQVDFYRGGERDVFRETGNYRAVAPPNPERIAYHAAMERKWRRAASHPWESVELDPLGLADHLGPPSPK